MYTTIYLVRHAEVKYTHDDYSRPLSEKGEQDALKLIEIFKDVEVSKVLSSPYLRAINTVKGVAEQKGIAIETIHDFRERKVSNVFIDDFTTFAKKQWEDFDFHLEEGESLNEVQTRGRKALKEVLKKYKGENIVIGIHGTILAVILNYFDEKHDYNFWSSIKMPDIFKFTFDEDELISITNMEV